VVAHFKIREGRLPAFDITPELVEERLGRRPPWFQGGQARGDDRHFAVCPYCDNPIQLKGIYRRQPTSPRPYGSHTGVPVDGFHFDALDLEFCPYRLKRKTHDKQARRAMGPMAQQLIDTAVAEFDRVVLILRDDFGFRFSDTFAERMLDQWFDSQGYLYAGAHLRNLPWMIAYFGPVQDLFGQPIARNAELADAIRSGVPQVHISERGLLLRQQGKTPWFLIQLQCLHHRIAIEEEGDELIERLKFRVQNFTDTNDAGLAPTLYTKEIIFRPQRFEALIHTPSERAQRDQGLLERAQNVAKKKRI